MEVTCADGDYVYGRSGGIGFFGRSGVVGRRIYFRSDIAVVRGTAGADTRGREEPPGALRSAVKRNGGVELFADYVRRRNDDGRVGNTDLRLVSRSVVSRITDRKTNCCDMMRTIRINQRE